jgi:hypothetical protein
MSIVRGPTGIFAPLDNKNYVKQESINYVFPNLFTNIQATDYGYLNTTKYACSQGVKISNQTITTSPTTVVFDNQGTALTGIVSNLFTLNSGTDFQYIGDKPEIYVSVNCIANLFKIATNTNTQMRILDLSNNIVDGTNTVYVDKAEGHLINAQRSVKIKRLSGIKIQLLCATGTVSLAMPNVISGYQSPACVIEIFEIPSP